MENDLAEFHDKIEKDMDNKLQSDLKMKKDDLADFVYNGELSRKISQAIYKVSQDLNILLSSGLQNIQDGAMMRIEEYLGGAKVSVKTEWKNLPKIDQKNNSAIKNEIELGELEIERLKMQGRQIENEQRRLIDDYQQNREEINEQQQNLDDLRLDYDQKIISLGAKPSVERKQITKTRERYRGGLGFLDTILGPKIEEYTETVPDSTKRDSWINKKNKVESDYHSNQERVNMAINDLNMKQQLLDDKTRELSSKQSRVKDAIKMQEKTLAMQKELLEKQKKVARREYLDNIKKIANKQLTEHFDIVSVDFRTNTANMLGDGEQTITTRALNIFNERFADRINEIKRSLSEDKNMINENKLNIDRAEIEKVMQNLEELV